MSMKKFLAILALLLPVGVMAQHWTAKTTYDYPNSTPVYVKLNINGVPANAKTPCELGAFVGGECRGYAASATVFDTPAASVELHELRVVGDLSTEAGQQITFRAFYENVEYEFTSKVVFSGETDFIPSNPLVLNLDAVTGVTLTDPIEISQPATAFPYTQDLTPNITFQYAPNDGSPYTPLGESTIVSPITYEWNVGNYVDQLTFDGNSLTIGPAMETSYGINLYVYIGNRESGECQSFVRIPTHINVTLAKIPVESITCSIESCEFYAWEDFYSYMQDKVTVLPADASEPGFYLQSDFLREGKFVEGGVWPVKVIPNDGDYEGEIPVVRVTVYERPTNIESTMPNGLKVGIGQNVYEALAASTLFSWMNDQEPNEAYTKKELSYTPNLESYIDETGVATKAGQVSVTVTLVNGITIDGSRPAAGQASYTVPVNIVSRLSMQVQQGEQRTYVKGVIDKASPALVYVTNPGNEPFEPNDLTIEFVSRYEGFPYAVQNQVIQMGVDEPTGATIFGFYIQPKFVSNNAGYVVKYQGQPIGDNDVITITQQQQLAEGWNWMAVASMTSADGTDVNTAFTSDDIIEVRSQTLLLYNDPVYGYFGDISRLRPDQATYKVKTNKATSVKLGSVSAFAAQQATAELLRGYNWMNNPFEFDIPASKIGDFLGETFKPSDGDRIITQEDGFAAYSDGAWVAPNGFVLKEGKGVIYYNASASIEPLYVNFNASLAPVAAGGGVKGFMSFEDNAAADIFQYDAHAFADNMSMVAVIEGLEDPENYTLGVFVNGECRGRGQVVKDGKMFVSAVGKVGEQLTFKLANNFTGVVTDLDETMTYSLIKGSLKAPVAISGSSVTGIAKTKQDVQDDAVYDMSGRRIQTMQKGIYIKNGKKFINK